MLRHFNKFKHLFFSANFHYKKIKIFLHDKKKPAAMAGLV